MPPRSVTVQLRAGVAGGRAILPDGRTIKTGQQIAIPWDDFQKISNGARVGVIQVVSMSNAPTARKPGINLAMNSATVPAGYKRGQVEDGAAKERFVLVKNVGANTVDGDVLVWTDKLKREVTRTHTATSEFAGVAQSVITSGNFGFIQTEGEVDAITVAGTPTAGDLLAVHPSTAGSARVATGGDKSFGVFVAANDAVIRLAAGRVPYRRSQAKRLYA